MRRIIPIALLLLSSHLCISQTKEITENWILSKFDKYKTGTADYDMTNPISEEPISLKFGNCYIELKEKFTQWMINGGSDPQIRVYKILIGDIKSFAWFGNVLHIKSRKTNVTMRSYSPNKNSAKETVDYLDGIRLGIRILDEDNLDNRIIKALEHLKSFCPT